MRCAVVGHVEWVEFAEVVAVPPPGGIANAIAFWEEPAGGGSVVSAQIARLAGGCDFFTALGDDDLGHRSVERLSELGVTVHSEWMGATRRAWTYVDANRERTITTLGPKLRPSGPLPLAGYDLVFFVAGNAEALRSARAARFLGATPRELPTLREGGVALDLLVGSGNDPGERYDGGLDAALVVQTDGAHGGIADGRRYEAATPPGPLSDTYGAGDSFAAALSFGLARGDELAAALDLATRAGAAVVSGRGPYSTQISA
ncbi:MAG: PfkB family carbohydrate kinase [Actinomycetes bacterium]